MSGHKTIWSVGGGKGGVGKSVITANMGCALAGMGREVMLVDADLGGANLHTYFGIKYPSRSLEDFLKGRFSAIEEAAIDTGVRGLRLISGGGEFLGIANPAFAQKQKLIAHIKKLDAEHIIVDLGAGSSYNTLDFFAISNEGIVVLVPEPAAIQNAYIFLKSFVYRRLLRLFSDNPLVSDAIKEATDAHGKNSVRTFSDLCERLSREDRRSAERALSEIKSFRPRILLNMAASHEDLKVVDAFRSAAGAFLSLDTEFVGAIFSRPSIKSAARKMRPFMLDDAAVDARRDMEMIVANLTATGKASGESGASQASSPRSPAQPPPQEVFGFNDDVSHMGAVFHVQTEAQGGMNPSVETIIYQGGRIFFSRKTASDEIRRNSAGMTIRDFAARQHRAAMAAIKMNKITFQG